MSNNHLFVDSNGRQYRRDSMERFGGDMTELIVSYLSVRDKHSLECVSKQWQRLIFKQFTSLHIYNKDDRKKNWLCDKQFNRNPLHWTVIFIDTEDDCNRVEKLFKKCPNIRQIVINGIAIEKTLIEVMADNCHRLQSLTLMSCQIPLKAMTLFGQSLGPKLKNLEIHNRLSNDEKYYEILLELCPNVETLVCDRFSDQRSDFLLKLNSLKTTINRTEVSLLTDFGLKYGKQLKVLSLTARDFDVFSIQVLRCVPLFEEITELELNFMRSEINIEKELKEIGNKCRKLKKLLIKINCSEIEGNVWKCLTNFTELNELKLSFNIVNTDQSIRDMGLKTNLKRLTVHSFNLNEEMFEDINRIVPNLLSIDIETEHQLSDTLLKSLSGLKHLKDLALSGNSFGQRKVTDSGVSQLLDNCPELKKIWFHFRRDITNKTIENLISFANRRPKQVIEFQFKSSNKDIDIKQFDYIPANLKISFS